MAEYERFHVVASTDHDDVDECELSAVDAVQAAREAGAHFYPRVSGTITHMNVRRINGAA